MAEKAAEKTPKAKGGKKKLPIIIGVVVLILALVVAKSVLGGGKSKKDKKVSEEVGISVPLDEFLVNLSGGGDHYLRATIALGMRKGITEEQEKEHIAPVRDAILSVLSSKSLDDLNKSKERDDLKEELRTKVNTATGDDSVVKVYFTAFATQ
jgi:flagellar FliL protein